MPHFERASFSGHETFPFRYTWLKKAVDAVGNDPRVFGREDAMVLFGTGKNMVSSVRHWGSLTGVIEEDPTVHNNRGRSLRVTELGRRLFCDDGWDPYLEDPGTLWLLHWQITKDPERATTWYWVFNQLSNPEFDRRTLVDELLRLSAQHEWSRVAPTSVKRDVDCFIRTYAPMRLTKRSVPEDSLDCPLVELGLLASDTGVNSYVIRRGEQASLPEEIFTYGLLEFVHDREHQARTISLEEILFGPGSPGRVFALNEDGALRRLESLSKLTQGKITYDETAGLKQVIIHEAPDSMALLNRYYRRVGKGGAS